MTGTAGFSALATFGSGINVGGQTITNFTGVGLTNASGTIRLTDTGVTAASYGSATSIPSFSVDAQGRITYASSNDITSSLLPTGSLYGETLRFNGTNWITNTNLWNDGSSIGIGTTNPLYALDINGTFRTSSTTPVFGSYTLTVPATGTAALGTGVTGYNAYWSDTNTLASEQYLSLARGGTGIGSTNPANGSLFIGNGTGYSLSTLTAGTGIGISNALGQIFISNTVVDTNTTYTAGNGLTLDPSNIFKLGGEITDSTRLYDTSYEYLFIDPATGNLGIGNTNPQYKLDVTGTAGFSALATFGSGINVGGQTITNFTGVGLTNASGTIRLTDTGVTAASYGSATSIPSFSVDAQGRITYASSNDITSSLLPTGSLNGETLRFNGTNWITNTNLWNDGSSIGIGTTNPLYALDINGTFRTSSTTPVFGSYTLTVPATGTAALGTGVTGQVAYW